MTENNPMRKIVVEKVTLNCGCGTDHSRLEKSVKLLQIISGKKPIQTKTNLRVANWGLRKGLPIGTKVTLRGKAANEIIPRLLYALDNQLGENNFDTNGNISFGIRECIDIQGVEYDPKIGIIGLQVTITLARPGFRVKRRAIATGKLGAHHKITKTEAMQFAKDELKVEFKQEEDEE